MKTTRYFVSALLFVMFHFITFCQTAGGEDITFEREGILLKGRFHLAPGTGKFPTAVLLNGFPGGGNDVLGIGKLLAEAGINVLTFNYSGTGRSQGLASFDNQQKDIKAAMDYICHPENISRFQVDTNQIYLGGWCHGGGMALVYAVGHPEITSVFSIVGNDFGEFMRLYVQNPEMKKIVDEMMDNSVSRGDTRFEEGALPKEMAVSGIENMNPLYDIRQKNAKALAQKDILLICAWDDERTTVEHFMLPLYRALKKENARNLQMISFQDVHHFPNTRKVLAAQVAEWIFTAPGRKQ